MVARYTMVIVNRGVWANTLGFYCTRGYGVVTGAVCEKKPAVWPMLHPRDNEEEGEIKKAQEMSMASLGHG